MVKPSIFYINKAKIVLFPIKNVRSIQINCMIKCGSWYEKENYGSFHFLEHMLFQGTKKLPTPELMTEFAKENGIHPNAYTSGKMINFYLEIPDVNLNEGLVALEETVFNPLIPEEKIKNELNILTKNFF
jgi:predicted Zn-dependent peptidase